MRKVKATTRGQKTANLLAMTSPKKDIIKQINKRRKALGLN